MLNKQEHDKGATIEAVTTILVCVAMLIVVAVLSRQNADKPVKEIEPSSEVSENIIWTTPTDMLAVGKLDTTDITEKENLQAQLNLSIEEFEMIVAVVQHEVGNVSYESKLAVTEVIINRVFSEDFPNTVAEVLHQGYQTSVEQFGAIHNYYDNEHPVTSDTIQAVKEVLKNTDTSHDAVYYANLEYCSNSTVDWFYNQTWLFALDGQDYFKGGV